jgi:hypothetical protein
MDFSAGNNRYIQPFTLPFLFIRMISAKNDVEIICIPMTIKVNGGNCSRRFKPLRTPYKKGRMGRF